jgi:heptosyltransferase-1
VIADVPATTSLLVVRLGAMGDVIHTMHAITSLRNAYPDIRMGWVVEERWAELLCAKDASRSGPRNSARPLVDFLHAVDTKGWRKSLLSRRTWNAISAAWHEIRSQKYEVAADYQGSLKSAAIAQCAGSRIVAGMKEPREAPARFFYGHKIATTGTHVIEQYESISRTIVESSLLVEASRAPSSVMPRRTTDLKGNITTVPFPCDEQAENKIDGILEGTSRNIVLITPGAGWRAKRWPADRYGKVARALADDGMASLINYGPGEETLATEAVSASGGAARPIACSIGELVALTRRARLFIGGDTGPLHLAAALRIPVVAIFGPTAAARNGPYGIASIVLRDSASPTSLSHTSKLDPGLLNITPDQVISAAHRLLETSVA